MSVDAVDRSDPCEHIQGTYGKAHTDRFPGLTYRPRGPRPGGERVGRNPKSSTAIRPSCRAPHVQPQARSSQISLGDVSNRTNCTAAAPAYDRSCPATLSQLTLSGLVLDVEVWPGLEGSGRRVGSVAFSQLGGDLLNLAIVPSQSSVQALGYGSSFLTSSEPLSGHHEDLATLHRHRDVADKDRNTTMAIHAFRLSLEQSNISYVDMWTCSRALSSKL